MKFPNPFKGKEPEKPTRTRKSRAKKPTPEELMENQLVEDENLPDVTNDEEEEDTSGNGHKGGALVVNDQGAQVVRRAPMSFQSEEAQMTLADYLVKTPPEKEMELTRLNDRDVQLLPLAEVEEAALDPFRTPGSLIKILRLSIYRHKKGYKAWHAIHIVNLAQGQGESEQFQHDIFK